MWSLSSDKRRGLKQLARVTDHCENQWLNGVWLLRADDTIELSGDSGSLLQQEILIQLRESNESVRHICHKIKVTGLRNQY